MTSTRVARLLVCPAHGLFAPARARGQRVALPLSSARALTRLLARALVARAMADDWRAELAPLFAPVPGLKSSRFAIKAAVPSIASLKSLRDQLFAIDRGLSAEGNAGTRNVALLADRLDEKTLDQTRKIVEGLIEARPADEHRAAVDVLRDYAACLRKRKIAPWPVTPRRIACFLISKVRRAYAAALTVRTAARSRRHGCGIVTASSRSSTRRRSSSTPPIPASRSRSATRCSSPP